MEVGMKRTYLFGILLVVIAAQSIAQMDSTTFHEIAIAKFLQDARNIENAMLNAEKVINAMQELLALQWWWGILASVLLPIPVIMVSLILFKSLNFKRNSLFQVYKKLTDDDIEKAKEILKKEYEAKIPSKLWIWIWASASVIFLIGWVFLLGYSNVSA